MGQVERYINKGFILRREWGIHLVNSDGLISIGRTMGGSARMSSSQEYLTEIHNDIEEQVDSITNSQSLALSLGIRELLTPQLQNYFFGDGVAPTILTRQVLKRHVESLVWPDDDENGNATEFQVPVPFGLPQTHDSTVFPPATGVTLTATGSGTIADDTYYAWVVPVYLDEDEFHGFTSLSLADFATKVRGREFVFGTPSSSDETVFGGGPQGAQVSWTEPSWASAVTKPTHWAVVMGTVDDINDTDSHIVAVVARGTSSTTYSAVGTVDFGADPALADLNSLESIAAGDPVTYSARTQDTDYTFDPATGIFKRITTSAYIKPGASVRAIAWRQSAASFEQKYAAAGGIDREVSLRFTCAFTRDGNATSRRAILGQLDVPRVRIKGNDTELLSSNPQGWHNVLSKNLTALYDPVKGYVAKFTGEHEIFENLIDFYSNANTPAGA